MAGCTIPTSVVGTPGRQRNVITWDYWPDEQFANIDNFTITKRDGSETASCTGTSLILTIPSADARILAEYDTVIPSGDFAISINVNSYHFINASYGPYARFRATNVTGNYAYRIDLWYDDDTGGPWYIQASRVRDGSGTQGTQVEPAGQPEKLLLVRASSTMRAYYYLSGAWTVIDSIDYSGDQTHLTRLGIRLLDRGDYGGAIHVSNMRAHIDAYNIYWDTTSGVTQGTGTKIAGVSDPHTHYYLNPGSEYYYVVTAENDEEGESADSDQIEVVPSHLYPGYVPVRTLTIGDSDYTNDVVKWPVISRTTNQLKSTNAKISLKNTEGSLNNYYNNFYTKQETVQLKYKEDAYSSEYTIYTGWVYDVQYKNRQCHIKCKDRISDFLSRKVGDNTDPACWGAAIPSDIAWVICTSYAGLDDTESAANTDIDYSFFSEWANVFSRDSITCGAYYTGMKASEALQNLAEMTNSDIWTHRDGKIRFKAKIEISSDYAVVTELDRFNLDISIETGKIINKQYVYGAYSSDASSYTVTGYWEDAASVNSYGLFEDVIKDESIWYTNSQMLINMAQKQVALFKTPPKTFNLKTPAYYMNMGVADKIRLVDSFFGITSVSAWRITTEKFDMNTGAIDFEMGGAGAVSPFVLDVSLLDGTDVLV